MSKVVATTVLPEDSGEVLTFGDTGDAIAISGDSLNLNVLQDAGGNNIFTSNGSGTITSTALGGAYKLLTTNTFTDQASSSFTTLIDSTYDVYIFKWYTINPATDDQYFTFNGSTDGGSNYNITKTTTYFSAYHDEANTYADLGYSSGQDLAQSTSYQRLSGGLGNDSDANQAGELHLFAPSNTTYVKHFYITANGYKNDSGTSNVYIAGFFNNTSAINAIGFKFESGNFDGTIKMYGLL